MFERTFGRNRKHRGTKVILQSKMKLQKTKFLYRKIVYLIVCAFFSFVCVTFSGCEKDPSAPGKDTRPEIIIGSDEYRPFFYMDGDGEFSGFDVALAEEAFKRLGYKATFMQIEWNKKDTLLENGEIDCLWGCFSMTGREDLYSWAGPYLSSTQSVLVKKDSDIQTIADLNGKSVAVQATAKPDEIFSAMLISGELTLKNLFCFAEVDNVFASLRKGYADAIAGHRTALDERIKNYSDNSYRYLEEPLVKVQIGVAFKKGSHSGLVRSLTEKLAEMTKDGTTEKLLNEYGIDVQSSLEGISGYEKE